MGKGKNGFQAGNFFNLYSSWKIFISPSILIDSFVGIVVRVDSFGLSELGIHFSSPF